jgi:hypothetical protein
MADYDFHQLSPHDFEGMARGLLQAEWGFPLESFKSGKEALSHCWKKNARILRLEHYQATAAASRHTFIAALRKARWVLADMKWRSTLNVLYAAA